MKIHVPTKQEKENTNIIDTPKTVTDTSNSYVTNSSGVSASNEKTEDIQNTKNSKININTATQTQLETLSGIGTSTATKIITYRKENGKFTKIEDIKKVSGIGDTKFEKIKDYITVK